MARKKKKTTGRAGVLTRLADDELLDLRFKDLGIRIEGTWLESMVEKLHDELADRGLRFRPHCWLSTEWFSPDGVPGIAIPFYLAHPRLVKLEQKQMFEVEGRTREWCMRILRHEAGHAIDTAYRLRRKRNWQRVFGRSSLPYPDSYRPRPYSRDYVLHLDWWYAQSHPLEDFAETFAVWLRPGGRWKKLYAGWPALSKLRYVDELMEELAGTAPPVRSRAHVDPVGRIARTLRQHYRAKRGRYGVALPDIYDQELLRLFGNDASSPSRTSAAAFLRRVRPELRQLVAQWTGEHAYTIDQFLNDMIARCRALGLRLDRTPEQTRIEAAIALTVQVMNYLHRGGHRVAL